TPFDLSPTVVYPTTLMLEPGGTVLIADARLQDTPHGQGVPYPPELRKKLVGDLVRVTLDPALQVKSLLGAVAPADNPLIYPNAIVPGRDGSLLVSDLGLKKGAPVNAQHVSDEDLVRVMAEPARFYRIQFTNPVIFTPLRQAMPMAQPSRMVWDGDRLL